MIRLAATAIVCLPLAGYLVLTCYQGLKSGKLRHTDSKSFVTYSKNPSLFIFIFGVFCFFIAVLLAGFFMAVMTFLSA